MESLLVKFVYAKRIGCMKNEILFRGWEINCDEYRAKEYLLQENSNFSSLVTDSIPYFKKYGFKVPKYFSDLYSKINGIISDKYISPSLYYFYINAILDNYNMYKAYDDKNMYSVLFPDIKQPETIIKNMNGKFYAEIGKEIDARTAILLIQQAGDFIIKPSMGTGGGVGVQKITRRLNIEEITSLLAEYKSDFIIQKPLKQHHILSSFNPTSLNTCRIVTYRRISNGEYVVLGKVIRFGGEGAIKDNACAGGGFCNIDEEGRVEDTVYLYHGKKHSLSKDYDIRTVQIPCFDKLINACIDMHKRLPYFDLIGWDVTLDEEGKVCLVEFNYCPDSEIIQIASGPLFGKYTDELMERITKPKVESVCAVKRVFDNVPKNNAYLYEIGLSYGL